MKINASYPPTEKNRTQTRHTWQRRTIEIPDIAAVAPAKPNASVLPNAAPVSADIAEAAETASTARKGIAHNSPPVAVEYDSPLAATETAGAAVNNTTRKKTNRSGEAAKDHMKPEAPLKTSQTPNNPDTELHQYHMH